MNKIAKVSQFFRVLFQVAFMLIPLLFVYAWIKAPEPLNFLDHTLVVNVIPKGLPVLHSLTMLHRLFGFCVTMLPVGMVMLGLYFLIRLFRFYEKGLVFQIENVRCIRNLGYVLIGSQFVQLIYDPLISLTLTFDNPKGYRIINIMISSTNFAVLLGGMLTLLISWVMLEACKLQEEQNLTV